MWTASTNLWSRWQTRWHNVLYIIFTRSLFHIHYRQSWYNELVMWTVSPLLQSLIKMVSMVDWSRFTRGSDLSANSSQPGSRYHKQRETEAIRQAEEQGYFLLASKSFIEDVFAPEDATQGTRSAKFAAGKTPKDLAQVQLIHLTSAHLRTVGDIGLCRNLKVCILSNNYIRRIDGLVTCEKLVKLDLGHNQVRWNCDLILCIKWVVLRYIHVAI